MSGVLHQATARVLRLGDGNAQSDQPTVVGSGVLVSTPQLGPCLLTCAHVVNSAFGWHQTATQAPEDNQVLSFDIPAKEVGPEYTYQARIVVWRPPLMGEERVKHPACDLALLQLLPGKPLPGDLRLHFPQDFKVKNDTALRGKLLHSFGFDREAGSHMSGKAEGRDASGWLILKESTDTGSFVAPGFSGAPVFDETRRFILGLVVSLDSERDRAFLQSTANIQRAIPELARPYRGLKVFEEEDADFFFGREDFIRHMLEKMQRHPLVGVTGASGAGKSSAIRAGVIPKLRADPSNVIVILRPGDDPWKALAKALIAEIPADGSLRRDIFDESDRAGDMARRLRAESGALKDYAAALLEKVTAGRLIILVDQFEELFTLAGHERPAEPRSANEPPSTSRKPDDFRDLMVATASLSGRTPIQWIFSLRGDFVDRAFRPPAFVERLGDGNILLPDLKPAELRLAISGPAAKLDVDFQQGTATQPGLVERIARDAGETAGALPLMEHVLELLWQGLASRRTADKFRHELTHEAYDRLGGLAGALDRHAENVYKTLAPADQQLLPRLVSRLVNVKEDGEATRRVATRSELREELWQVAAKLADEDCRLLVMRSGPKSEAAARAGEAGPSSELGTQTVEVAHEALLRNWSRLQEWIRNDRRFLLWRQRLALQIKDHDNPDVRGTLLAGGPLETARFFLTTKDHDLSEGEKNFIKQSQAEEDKLKAEKERQQKDRERQRNMLVIALLVIAVLSVLAAVGGGILTRAAQDEKKRADEQAKLAISNETQALLALSKTELSEGRPVDALKFALAAWPRNASDDRPHLDNVPVQVAAPFINYSIPLRTFAHNQPVTGALVMPDGRRTLSWSVDGTLQLWDLSTGKPAGPSMKHDGAVASAIVMPDGRILSWSADKTLRLWDSATGRQVGVTMKHDAPIRGALVMPGGQILSWSRDATLRLWNAATGQQVGPPMTHGEAVSGALVMPDGRILSWSSDNTLRVWDAATAQQVGPSMERDHLIRGALVMPDGRILSWSLDILQLWDAATGQPVGPPMTHDSLVVGALVMPDGRILSWSTDYTLRLWDAATSQPVAQAMKHDDIVLGARVMPDGRILSRSNDNTLRLWDAATGQQVGPAMKHDGVVAGAIVLPDGRILSWSRDKAMKLWDASTGQQAGPTMKHEDVINGAIFVPEGHILSWSRDSTLRLWDASLGQQVGPPMKHDDMVFRALEMPDGRILSWSSDNTLRLWNAANGQQVGPSMKHEEVVVGALVMPDGRILSWSRDKTLRLWSAATGQRAGPPMTHDDSVSGALVMPDGRILSWSRDKTLRLWSAATSQQSGPPMTHDDPVVGALAMPDGRILSWSEDNTLRLWDAATGQQVGPSMVHDDPVAGALVMPDGRILSWSRDKTLRLWNAATGQQVGLVMAHQESIRSALVMPDGRILSWSEDDALHLWDAATGQQVVPPMKHEDTINGALVISNKQILSWSSDNSLRLWDAASGRQVGPSLNHGDTVVRALAMADGRIMSWSFDNTLRLWDLATGQQIGPPMKHGSSVYGALVMQDDRILSWSADQTLRLWKISWPTGNIFEIACALLDKNFDLSTIKERFGLEIRDPICADPAGIPTPNMVSSAGVQQQPQPVN